MPALHFQITISSPPQAIFDCIADFAHYDQWLPGSDLYKSTVELSENPVRQGTTYVDKGTSSTMHGQVTLYQPPAQIGFHQTTRLKLLGVIPAGLEVSITYKLKATGSDTQLERDVTVQTKGVLRLIQSVLIKRISAESERILSALKTHLEKVG